MCDYSLLGLKSRLAIEGEDLVIRNFITNSHGLAPARESLRERLRRAWLFLLAGRRGAEPLAVCVPPGARLLLSGSRGLTWSDNQSQTAEVVFMQRSAEAFMHRDAVRFENGDQVSLQMLKEGVVARVLSLELEEAEEERPREELVHVRSSR